MDEAERKRMVAEARTHCRCHGCGTHWVVRFRDRDKPCPKCGGALVVKRVVVTDRPWPELTT